MAGEKQKQAGCIKDFRDGIKYGYLTTAKVVKVYDAKEISWIDKKTNEQMKSTVQETVITDRSSDQIDNEALKTIKLSIFAPLIPQGGFKEGAVFGVSDVQSSEFRGELQLKTTSKSKMTSPGTTSTPAPAAQAKSAGSPSGAPAPKASIDNSTAIAIVSAIGDMKKAIVDKLDSVEKAIVTKLTEVQTTYLDQLKNVLDGMKKTMTQGESESGPTPE